MKLSYVELDIIVSRLVRLLVLFTFAIGDPKVKIINFFLLLKLSLAEGYKCMKKAVDFSRFDTSNKGNQDKTSVVKFNS